MKGILLVDKPKGWTSFDVVAKVRGILKNQIGQRIKVGHIGTLDPLATGLLVLLIGNYTKQATELTKLDKTYEVVMKLGQTSSTGDEEGEKTDISEEKPSLEALQTALKGLVGEIEQIPPQFSAIKINGQRAYKLARAGKEVKLEPRKVKIYEITELKYDYPEVKFTCRVSSGTYIRSLVEDIGQALGVGAYMTDLRRAQVGNFSINQSIQMNALTAEQIQSNLLLA